MSDEVRHQGRFGDYAQDPEAQQRGPWLSRALWALGPVAALAVWLALDEAQGLTGDARAVAAIGKLMAIWLTTEAIPLPASSLLPMVL